MAVDVVLINLNLSSDSSQINPALSYDPSFIINPASLTASPVTPLARYINESSIERFSVFNTVVVPLIVRSPSTIKLEENRELLVAVKVPFTSKLSPVSFVPPVPTLPSHEIFILKSPSVAIKLRESSQNGLLLNFYRIIFQAHNHYLDCSTLKTLFEHYYL